VYAANNVSKHILNCQGQTQFAAVEDHKLRHTHIRFLTMSRTTTTHATTFSLPAPKQADLVFSSDPALITVSIPRGSQWRMPLHWHFGDTLGCISVKGLTGNLHVYWADERGSCDRLGAGTFLFKPGKVESWNSARDSRPGGSCTEDWSVAFVVPDQNLYRSVSTTITLRVLSEC